jgi:hypothetical protein
MFPTSRPCDPIKEQELCPLAEEIKEVNLHHNKNISSIPLSEEHCWSTRREKNTKP